MGRQKRSGAQVKAALRAVNVATVDDFEQDATQRDMLWSHVEKASRRLMAILTNRNGLEQHAKTATELGALEDSVPVDCNGLMTWAKAMENDSYQTHVRKRLTEARLRASAKSSSHDTVALAWVALFHKLREYGRYDLSRWRRQTEEVRQEQTDDKAHVLTAFQQKYKVVLAYKPPDDFELTHLARSIGANMRDKSGIPVDNVHVDTQDGIQADLKMYRNHALEVHLMDYIQSDDQKKSQIAALTLDRLQILDEKSDFRAARKLEQLYNIATAQQDAASTNEETKQGSLEDSGGLSSCQSSAQEQTNGKVTGVKRTAPSENQSVEKIRRTDKTQAEKKQ